MAVLAGGILYHTTHELAQMMEKSGISLGLLSKDAYNLGIAERGLFNEEGAVGGIIHSFTGFMQSGIWLSVLSYVIYWMIMGTLLYRTYRMR